MWYLPLDLCRVGKLWRAVKHLKGLGDFVVVEMLLYLSNVVVVALCLLFGCRCRRGSWVGGGWQRIIEQVVKLCLI